MEQVDLIKVVEDISSWNKEEMDLKGIEITISNNFVVENHFSLPQSWVRVYVYWESKIYRCIDSKKFVLLKYNRRLKWSTISKWATLEFEEFVKNGLLKAHEHLLPMLEKVERKNER